MYLYIYIHYIFIYNINWYRVVGASQMGISSTTFYVDSIWSSTTQWVLNDLIHTRIFTSKTGVLTTPNWISTRFQAAKNGSFNSPRLDFPTQIRQTWEFWHPKSGYQWDSSQQESFFFFFKNFTYNWILGPKFIGLRKKEAGSLTWGKKDVQPVSPKITKPVDFCGRLDFTEVTQLARWDVGSNLEWWERSEIHSFLIQSVDCKWRQRLQIRAGWPCSARLRSMNNSICSSPNSAGASGS